MLDTTLRDAICRAISGPSAVVEARGLKSRVGGSIHRDTTFDYDLWQAEREKRQQAEYRANKFENQLNSMGACCHSGYCSLNVLHSPRAELQTWIL
jgi:hypothetical protein